MNLEDLHLWGKISEIDGEIWYKYFTPITDELSFDDLTTSFEEDKGIILSKFTDLQLIDFGMNEYSIWCKIVKI